MYQAVKFTVNTDGIATSYSLIPYKKNFVTEVKNQCFKTHLAGFTTVALAEATANSLVGTLLDKSLPPVRDALRGGQISQPTVEVDELTEDATTGAEVADDGLQTGNSGDETPTSHD